MGGLKLIWACNATKHQDEATELAGTSGEIQVDVCAVRKLVMNPRMHEAVPSKPDLCGSIEAKEHGVFRDRMAGYGVDGLGVASCRRGLHFDRKDSLGVVIGPSDGVAEGFGTVFFFEELAVVEDHVVAKVSRGDFFSDGGNELFSKEVLDVLDALCVGLHEGVGVEHASQQSTFGNRHNGFIAREDFRQALQFLVDASELLGQERVDIRNRNDLRANLERTTILFSL